MNCLLLKFDKLKFMFFWLCVVVFQEQKKISKNVKKILNLLATCNVLTTLAIIYKDYKMGQFVMKHVCYFEYCLFFPY